MSEFRAARNLVEFFSDQFDALDMQDSQNRITVNPRQCGGRPCVRGMPDLEAEDLKACLTYARRRIDHPVLAV